MKPFHLIIFVFCLLVPLKSMGAETSGGDMEPLPALQLTIPDNQAYLEYLGVKGQPGEKFSLSDIDADMLVVELFSMYCPYCQKEAPMVNELYEKMEALKATGKTVKLIGLGASNSQFEVEYFRDTYDVEFPVFPDKDMTLYKALKGGGTPSFIGIRLNGEDGAVVVLRNFGGFYNSDDFLAELTSKGGL